MIRKELDSLVTQLYRFEAEHDLQPAAKRAVNNTRMNVISAMFGLKAEEEKNGRHAANDNG